MYEYERTKSFVIVIKFLSNQANIYSLRLSIVDGLTTTNTMTTNQNVFYVRVGAVSLARWLVRARIFSSYCKYLSKERTNERARSRKRERKDTYTHIINTHTNTHTHTHTQTHCALANGQHGKIESANIWPFSSLLSIFIHIYIYILYILNLLLLLFSSSYQSYV